MKIRIETGSLNRKNVSGIGYYTQRLASALAEEPSIQIESFSFNFLGRQPQQPLSDKVSTRTNKLFPLRIYAKLESHGLAPAFDIFMKKVDLTIFPNYSSWPTVNSRLIATTIHDLTYVKHPELVEEGNLAHLNRVTKRSIAKSDYILTVSETAKNELVETFGVSPDKIITTSIPPEEKFFRPSSNEIHNKYGIPTDKYILFISTIEPRKNLPKLIEAYRLLPKIVQDEYSLVIAGGMGWKSEESQQSIAYTERDGLNVKYIGYIDEEDKSALYQKASLYVMPSIYEGFGMPILEAFASKVPVVASNIPVLRETAGEGAVFFEHNNPADISSSISSVLSDPKISSLLIKKGQQELKKHSWPKNAKKLLRAVS